MIYQSARRIVTEALARVSGRSKNPYFNDVPRDPVFPIYGVRPTPPDFIPPSKPTPPTARPPLRPGDLDPVMPNVLPTGIPPIDRPIPNLNPRMPYPGYFKSKTSSKSAKASNGKIKMAGKGTASASQAYAGAAKSIGVGGKNPGLDAPEGLGESHNIETLKGIPTPRLHKLHAKYKAKGTKEASREAAVIKRILASRMNEAVSTNDPNRGRTGRKKPLVPQGMMPDDTKDPRTGNPVRTLGKLQSRMSKLSPETRDRYRKNYGYRTRVAGRKGRLYPMSEEEKKDRYEGQESTKSMIARLVARRHRKLGMKVPADVEHDIDPKYKTKED